MRTMVYLRHWVCILVCAGFFALTVQQLKRVPKPRIEGEIEVALPLFVQVLLSAGDRYLAANIAAVRAVIADPQKMSPDEFKVLAKVQQDVSWLNPRHEDNYYTAAAILPWYGQVDASQVVLRRAMLTRLFDYQPGFFYGFGLYHFKGDPTGASVALRQTAQGLPENDESRLMVENLAALWLDKADDTDMAIGVVESMAREAKRRDFRQYLELRVQRLRMLKQLREAAVRYQQETGQPLKDLSALVSAGQLKQLPQDPFGFGFSVNADGNVFLKN